MEITTGILDLEGHSFQDANDAVDRNVNRSSALSSPLFSFLRGIDTLISVFSRVHGSRQDKCFIMTRFTPTVLVTIITLPQYIREGDLMR